MNAKRNLTTPEGYSIVFSLYIEDQLIIVNIHNYDDFVNKSISITIIQYLSEELNLSQKVMLIEKYLKAAYLIKFSIISYNAFIKDRIHVPIGIVELLH